MLFLNEGVRAGQIIQPPDKISIFSASLIIIKNRLRRAKVPSTAAGAPHKAILGVCDLRNFALMMVIFAKFWLSSCEIIFWVSK